MPLALSFEAQNELLTRLFKREDMFLDWEIAAGVYHEDVPSPRMSRINAMILRVVDMLPTRSYH